jgi:hypothetical protein
MKFNKTFNNKKILNLYKTTYYNELLNNDIKKNIKSIHKIGYPIFYREVYYFWLSGEPLKVEKKKYKLNEVIKFKSSMDKSVFIVTIPLQIPYLAL